MSVHRYPASLVGPDAPDEVLAWKCAACGEWVSEFEPDAFDCQPPTENCDR